MQQCLWPGMHISSIYIFYFCFFVFFFKKKTILDCSSLCAFSIKVGISCAVAPIFAPLIYGVCDSGEKISN